MGCIFTIAKSIFYFVFVFPFVFIFELIKAFAKPTPKTRSVSKSHSMFKSTPIRRKKHELRYEQNAWADVGRSDTTNKNWSDPNRNYLDNDIQQLEQTTDQFDQ